MRYNYNKNSHLNTDFEKYTVQISDVAALRLAITSSSGSAQVNFLIEGPSTNYHCASAVKITTIAEKMTTSPLKICK